jgi:hypothetical protein
MPKVEVDEAEYNQMVALRGVATKIAADPKARKIFESAHKMVDPNALTPLTDAEKAQLEPVNAIKSELSAEIAALKKEREDEKRDRTLAALAAKQTEGLAKLRRAGYTDEGVAAIQKLMEDKGLPDVEDAVAIFERNNPPPLPSTPSGGIGSWSFTDSAGEADKNIKDLISTRGDSEQIADRMAREALNDFRGQMGRR